MDPPTQQIADVLRSKKPVCPPHAEETQMLSGEMQRGMAGRMAASFSRQDRERQERIFLQAFSPPGVFPSQIIKFSTQMLCMLPPPPRNTRQQIAKPWVGIVECPPPVQIPLDAARV